MGNDPVTNPSHYQTESGIEAIEVIEAFFPDSFHLASVFKYIARAGKKGNRLEDLRKAAWYLQREIERHEKSSANVVAERLDGSINLLASLKPRAEEGV